MIPRAPIPNKPAYRTNPIEAKELQKQVEELLARGYVRGSLSPCVVPTLLVPKKDGLWRMCVDSRSVNNITVKYKFPMPKLDDILIYSGTVREHLEHLRKLFEVLRKQQLYGKIKKCAFMLSEVNFLRFIIGKEGIKVDPVKVGAITTWPTPTTITHVRSFHGLASFYRRFIKNFSSIMSPLAECTKKGVFEWTIEAQAAFEQIKGLMCKVPILRLPDFTKPFKVECDASGKGIGVMLIQEGRPVAYFSEKLNGSRLNYSTYDREFYAIIRAIETWSYYLKVQPFILHSDHESLKHINGQSKLNSRHGKRVEFLQSFTFSTLSYIPNS